VAIDAGRLLRTAPLGTFTELTGQLVVETEDAVAPLAERLGARGFAAEASGRVVVIDLDTAGGGEHGVYDAVRDEAVALNLPLVRIEHRRHQLEDLFRSDAGEGGADERVA
jgi:ABC-2 type transport system ATP-binding protein